MIQTITSSGYLLCNKINSNARLIGVDYDIIINGVPFTGFYGTYIVKKLNQLWSVETRIFDKGNRDLIKEGNTIEIRLDNKRIFKGEIRNVKYIDDLDEYEVKGFSKAITLFDRMTDRQEWTNIEAADIIRGLITGIMNEGTIENYGLITYRVEHDHKLRGCAGVAQVCDYDWYVDQDISDNDQFNFVSFKGSLTPVETFDIEKDIALIDRDKGTDKIYNKIKVLGYGDGINQISATAEDIPSQTEWGIREGRFIDRSIIEQNTAQELADKLIEKYKQPVERYVVILNKDEMTADLGDMITLKERDGSTKDLRILGIEYNQEDGNILLELGNIKEFFLGDIEEMQKNLEITDRYGQGATNIFAIPAYENCDETHPLNIRFYIPPETKAINHVKLNFKMKEFRAYSQATAGGGATTSGSSGSHYHDVAIGSHNHSINAATSAEMNNESQNAVWTGGGYYTTPTSWSWMLNWGVNPASHSFIYVSCVNWDNSNQRFYVRARDGNTGEYFPNADGEKSDIIAGYGLCSFILYVPGGRSNIYVEMKGAIGNTVGFHWAWTGISRHNHPINANTANSVDLGTKTSSNIGNHTHSIPDHTHSINFGIYEHSYSSPSVTIKVGPDGGSMTTIGTYTTNQTDIDITSYIGSVGQWYNVEITPNQKLRIESNIYTQIFIQSE